MELKPTKMVTSPRKVIEVPNWHHYTLWFVLFLYPTVYAAITTQLQCPHVVMLGTRVQQPYIYVHVCSRKILISIIALCMSSNKDSGCCCECVCEGFRHNNKNLIITVHNELFIVFLIQFIIGLDCSPFTQHFSTNGQRIFGYT